MQYVSVFVRVAGVVSVSTVCLSGASESDDTAKQDLTVAEIYFRYRSSKLMVYTVSHVVSISHDYNSPWYNKT